jgi:hypothetical protein
LPPPGVHRPRSPEYVSRHFWHNARARGCVPEQARFCARSGHPRPSAAPTLGREEVRDEQWLSFWTHP